MTRVAYALDEFIHDMSGLVASHPDQRTLFDHGSALMERLARDPESIPEQFRLPYTGPGGRRAGGGSYVLHRGPGLLITTVIWGAGSHIGPHDHQTWGMIGVLGNGIQEARYRRVDDRTRDGYAKLVKDRSYLIRQGEVSLLLPEEDEIHALDNFSDRPTVELHVYGADLVGLPRHQYDVERETVKAFASGKFDNC